MNKDKKSSSKKSGSKRVQTRVAGKLVSAPVSVTRSGRLSMGLSDITSLKIGYVLGVLQTGGIEAGTSYKLGVAGEVYFVAPLGSNGQWTPTNATDYKKSGPVPIAPSDATYGAVYLKNLFSLFRRKRFKKVRLVVVPVGQGVQTTGSTTITIAPGRSGESTFIAKQLDGTTAYPTASSAYGLVAGCKGAIEFPSWQGGELDLTPYISGPGGGREFTTTGDISALAWEFMPSANAGRVPCHFWVAGTTAITTAVVVASVRAELEVDLIDFSSGLETLGEVASPAPRGADSKENLPRPRAAESAAALPYGMPCLTRQTGYVMVQQEDLPALALAKSGGVPPNDPNRRS